VSIWNTRRDAKIERDRIVRVKERDQKDKRIEELLIRREEDQDKAALKIAELLKLADMEKDKVIRERWDRFNKTLCAVKEDVGQIVKDMNGKVSYDHCTERMDKMEDKIERIERT
jgi:hypothetical protein